MANDKVQETVTALCDWIIRVAQKGGTENEIKALPETAKAIADLLNYYS